jgi:hypothetical protein
MVVRNLSFLIAAVLVNAALGADDVSNPVSNPVFLYVHPEKSSFWSTATNSTIKIPIDFPAGVSSAELEVKGLGYSKVYKDITSPFFELQLPEAESAQTENVYELTLSFKGGITRTAKIGLISGVTPGAEGTTRCITAPGATNWNKIKYRAVVPISYGTTLFTYSFNGAAPVTNKLTGAQGWLAVGKVARNADVQLSASTEDGDVSADLLGWGDGLFFKLK